MATTTLATAVAFVILGGVLSTFLYLPALAAAESFAPRRARARAAIWLFALILPIAAGAAGASIGVYSALYDKYGSPHLTAGRPHICSRWLTSFPDARATVTIAGILGISLVAAGIVRTFFVAVRSATTFSRIARGQQPTDGIVEIDHDSVFAATVGLASPLVLVTSGAHKALDEGEFAAAMAHEAAHARHRDNLWGLVVAGCRTCLAFAPTAHLFLRYWHRETERACDIEAAETVGPEAVTSAMVKLTRAGQQSAKLSFVPAALERWRHTAANVHARSLYLLEQYPEENAASAEGTPTIGILLVTSAVVAFALATIATARQADDTLHCLAESLLAVLQ